MSDRLAFVALIWGAVSAAILIKGGVSGEWVYVIVGASIGLLSLFNVLLAVWVDD